MAATIEQKISSIINAAEDKKAKDIITMDLKKTGFLADYFILMSGNSDVHIRAIRDGIKIRLEQNDVSLGHEERDKQDSWILLDYGDIIVHIFHEEARKFYALERLWGDGKIKHHEKKPKRTLSRNKSRHTPVKRGGKISKQKKLSKRKK